MVRVDAGYVTAETSVVLPTLVLLAGILIWGVMLGAAQIQCVDAARVGARAAARGEPKQAVTDAVRSVAPGGVDIGISAVGESDTRQKIRVTVRARTAGPGPLTLPLEAEAVGLAEPGVRVD